MAEDRKINRSPARAENPGAAPGTPRQPGAGSAMTPHAAGNGAPQAGGTPRAHGAPPRPGNGPRPQGAPPHPGATPPRRRKKRRRSAARRRSRLNLALCVLCLFVVVLVSVLITLWG